MSVAQPIKDSNAPRPRPTEAERLVDQLANRIGGLGVELADVAGNLQEVAGRVSIQSDRFGHLQKTATRTMVSANHNIASASQAVRNRHHRWPRLAKSPSRAPRSRSRFSISPN